MREDNLAAIAYAKKNRLRLAHLPAAELCDQAMTEFFKDAA